MTGKQRPYIAYLVRLWLAGSADAPVWRASLEDPHTGERRGYASLDALCAFLAEQTRGSVNSPPGLHPVTDTGDKAAPTSSTDQIVPDDQHPK